MKTISIFSTARRALLALMIGGIASTVAFGAAHAESWPTRTVTIVVPYGPGASNDIFTRALAAILAKKFGQPFVVDNRAGAGGFTGASSVSRAAADGYTFLESPNAIASFKDVMKFALDPTTDLQAVGTMARAPYGMVVPSSLPVTTVQEFVTYAKAHPDNTLYGLTGLGTTQQFLSEVFNHAAGLKMKGINYKSSADTTIDLIAGRLQIEFITVATVIGQLQSGQLRLLAYANDSYPPGSPKAPLMADEGFKGMEFGHSWWGIFAPKKTPDDIVNKMNAAINEAIRDPDFMKLLAQSGASPAPSTPDDFSKAVAEEAALLAKIMKEDNIKIE